MGMMISTVVGLPLLFAAGVMFAIIASKMKDAAKGKGDMKDNDPEQATFQKVRKYAIISASTCIVAAIVLLMIAIFAF
jgi:hypothetical protein